MIVVPCVNSAWFDVDDTLIMWKSSEKAKEKYGIEITCPESLIMNEDGELVAGGSWTVKVVPHRSHIEQLKLHKSRGHLIVVWSAGGWDWANAAVKALGLEKYVDVVMSKPTWTYDDKKPEEFMPPSGYIKDVVNENNCVDDSSD